MPPPSPRHEIAHLGHVELFTPEPEKSLDFFVRLLGLTENGSDGNTVYLRTWDDYEHHSLKLTAAKTSGVGRTALRASSEEALQRRVVAIEERGLGVGWVDGDAGIGPTYLFRDPDGHELEVYWETERYDPPEHLRPALKTRRRLIRRGGSASAASTTSTTWRRRPRSTAGSSATPSAAG
ncbi:VOC family protein [Amycolatopsis sp. cmx-4-68]|uniref:VOC family protein n=1 Tax=Amycolatopsis sp. cmx-4-68 TaxID=2790938 RepID=UPI0039787AB6